MLVKAKKGADFPNQSLACGNTDRRQTIKQYLGHRFRCTFIGKYNKSLCWIDSAKRYSIV